VRSDICLSSFEFVTGGRPPLKDFPLRGVVSWFSYFVLMFLPLGGLHFLYSPFILPLLISFKFITEIDLKKNLISKLSERHLVTFDIYITPNHLNREATKDILISFSIIFTCMLFIPNGASSLSAFQLS
jgi:hypothetical protein